MPVRRVLGQPDGDMLTHIPVVVSHAFRLAVLSERTAGTPSPRSTGGQLR